MVAKEGVVAARINRPKAIRAPADLGFDEMRRILHLLEAAAGNHYDGRLDVIREGRLKAVEVIPPGRLLTNEVAQIGVHLMPVHGHPNRGAGD